VLDQPASAGPPAVVVRDNGSIHHRRLVHDALPARAARRLPRFFLPPYASERSAIARVLGASKRTHRPERWYAIRAALAAAVQQAVTASEQERIAQHEHQPGVAA
jgi:transposase